MDTPRLVTSRHNPLIKEALKIKDRIGLQRVKKTRWKPGYKDRIGVTQKRETSGGDLLLIDGQHAIEMALSSRFRIVRIFFSSKYRNSTFLERFDRDTEMIETTERIISELSDTEHPQGIIAVATYETFELSSIRSGKDSIFVVCDGIQDPGNLGTIIRTSDAAGADAVIILPGTCDPFMQKVIRASAGSIFNIPVIFSEKDNLKKWIRKRDIRLIVTAPGSSSTIYDLNLNGSIAFAFGNEARGVSEELITGADEIVSIPILGKAESLNVSVAASICLYEAVRQRKLGRSEGI